MTGRPATLLDVARVSGVSKSTVSDALQGTGRVAEATRERVRRVARELGYRPNSAARSLRRSSTGSIGLRLPRTATRLDYYMSLAFGVVERAQEAGLDVMLLAPGGSADGLAARVDGLVIVDPDAEDAALPALLDAGVPVVTGERYPGPAAAPHGVVVCDTAGSLNALLDHVRERGARRPALLAPDGTSAWAVALRDTAADWARAHDTDVAVRLVPFVCSPAEAEEAAAALLASDPAVDAIVCAPDGAAPGVLRAAAGAGRRVGTDLPVASCVDGAAMRNATPPVTAVDLDPAGYGRACADLLSDLLAGTEQPGTVREHPWEPRLRDSTRR
ncbi:LacI family DNA-binding transcriptional regulator [Embleya hyalina]|uniref:Putative LacI-family transcriptional regulator n=1 Tax=Embleya hyalina TaxID=516124 RepID=A0A401YLY5_9ACTN|nr:LacI family DNA-binding transcriptional regulator [Embleya hyalina]GCD95519.1 putative LacI-family transcriptional regulator [Embleya hyalina]